MKLAKPQLETGKTLMQALHERKSVRDFHPRQLDEQTLSNLLWAAFGINRPDTQERTAPSAHNWQEIDIYLATTGGIHLYDAKSHSLQPISSQDMRAMTGTQDFVGEAPVNLIFVADFDRMGTEIGEDEKKIVAASDAGFIGQNVYLFCASEGLANVVRGSINREALARTMKLKPAQWIVLAQSVGYSGN